MAAVGRGDGTDKEPAFLRVVSTNKLLHLTLFSVAVRRVRVEPESRQPPVTRGKLTESSSCQVSWVLNVTGQTQRGRRQDGLFFQIPDVNSDPRDHIGPDPISYADPQPVAARRSVLSQGQLPRALIHTEVSEESTEAIKQEEGSPAE